MTATFAKKFSITTLIQFGGACIGISGFALLILITVTPLEAWQILLPVAFATVGVTSVRAAATTGALASIPEKAGQGAAGLNLMQFMLSAVIATGISEINNPQMSLGILAIVCSILIITLMKLNLFKREILIME